MSKLDEAFKNVAMFIVVAILPIILLTLTILFITQ
jgi:hypothetical protein